MSRAFALRAVARGRRVENRRDSRASVSRVVRPRVLGLIVADVVVVDGRCAELGVSSPLRRCVPAVRARDRMLRARNTRSALSLVDVADDAYSPSENAGIEYETAMATIHGLTPDQRVITGVEVFERAYAAVGMG